MEQLINDKRVNNTWAAIKLADLPDGMPVLGISTYHNKNFAEFHLIEYCLIPKEVNDALKAQASVATEAK